MSSQQGWGRGHGFSTKITLAFPPVTFKGHHQDDILGQPKQRLTSDPWR